MPVVLLQLPDWKGIVWREERERNTAGWIQSLILCFCGEEARTKTPISYAGARPRRHCRAEPEIGRKKKKRRRQVFVMSRAEMTGSLKKKYNSIYMLMVGGNETESF